MIGLSPLSFKPSPEQRIISGTKYEYKIFGVQYQLGKNAKTGSSAWVSHNIKHQTGETSRKSTTSNARQKNKLETKHSKKSVLGNVKSKKRPRATGFGTKQNNAISDSSQEIQHKSLRPPLRSSCFVPTRSIADTLHVKKNTRRQRNKTRDKNAKFHAEQATPHTLGKERQPRKGEDCRRDCARVLQAPHQIAPYLSNLCPSTASSEAGPLTLLPLPPPPCRLASAGTSQCSSSSAPTIPLLFSSDPATEPSSPGSCRIHSMTNRIIHSEMCLMRMYQSQTRLSNTMSKE